MIDTVKDVYIVLDSRRRFLYAAGTLEDAKEYLSGNPGEWLAIHDLWELLADIGGKSQVTHQIERHDIFVEEAD